MNKFQNWWKEDKRYLTMIKAVLMASLPILCCLITCARQGKTIGEVYLPVSEWNDELFYFKQVEGIVNYGFPQGYFGFNESHALKLSFAAWSPVLVFLWILWGLLFGWNLMSPIICNILLLTLAVFAFVWLVKPSWRQLGVLTLLFSLYTPFSRYMLSGMPEIICFSMLIVFYGLAINYLEQEKGYKLVLLFVISGLLVLMRPYMLLFLLLPMYLWVKKSKWKGLAGSVAVLGVVTGAYALIKHYLGAEYFAPLFFTDWITTFFDEGIGAGIHNFFGTLYYMGKDFWNHTVNGFQNGLASGAFFGGYLVMMGILLWQSLVDWHRLHSGKNAENQESMQEAPSKKCEKQEASSKKCEKQEAPSKKCEKQEASSKKCEKQEASSKKCEKQEAPSKKCEKQEVPSRKGEKQEAPSKERESLQLQTQVIVQAHLALCFVGMLFALLLMYKLTEGSKHLLTFMAVGIFVISLMRTRTFKKTVLLGAVFAYLYSYMAVEPYDYQVPFAEQERVEQLAYWSTVFDENLQFVEENVPNFDNVVIWVFSDSTEAGNVNAKWQIFYELPEGFGISCCMPDYVTANLENMESRYIATVAGGSIDTMCKEASYKELGRDEDMVLYERY